MTRFQMGVLEISVAPAGNMDSGRGAKIWDKGVGEGNVARFSK